MAVSRTGISLVAWIGQVLFLAHILIIANSHPHGNFSVYHSGVEGDMIALAKRVSQKDFQSLDKINYPNILFHTSCGEADRIPAAGSWLSQIQNMKLMSRSAKEAARRTVEIIDEYRDQERSSMESNDRRLIDIFQFMYGSFDWKDEDATARAFDRAQWLQAMATRLDDILTKHKGLMYILCKSSEWVQVGEMPNLQWMLKDFELGPRFPKLTDDICITPENKEANIEDGTEASGFTTYAEREITPSDYITLCDLGMSKMKYTMTTIYKAQLRKNQGVALQTLIERTPQALLIHEFSHGKGAFWLQKTSDYAYGQNDIGILAQSNAAKTVNPEQYIPLRNADTFAYWVCGVYIRYCNFGTGFCRDASNPISG